MRTLEQQVEKLRSWNGKNYNGIIYVNNEKIDDPNAYLWAQEMKKGFFEILETRPFSIMNNRDFQNKLLVACDYIIVSAIITGSYVPLTGDADIFGMGKELAKAASLRIEYMIENQKKNISNISISEIVEETNKAILFNG